ncbi:hypothetical protein QA599_05045 [Haloarculaceae archaeon H-GB1-1]|nr:hypothetical protein [Haloarculaceae archaeon H-GB1-1]
MSHSRRWIVLLAGLPFAVGTAAAHSGTTHAGTPHWLLLFLVLGGLAVAAVGWRAFTRQLLDARFAVGVLFGGIALAVFGSIGLVEIQVAPRATPEWTDLFPIVNAIAGALLAMGSLVVGRIYWPTRPRYTFLGMALAAWVMYPSVMPTGGLTNPLGYLLAAAVPIGVAYVLHVDGGDRIRAGFSDLRAKAAAAVAFAFFAVFFAFSAGTLTVNPDLAAGVPRDGFVTTYRVASPLVYWPAVEFYLPAIPLSGYVSVGTLLLVVLLGGLVALNVGLVAQQWAAIGEVESARSMLGAFASSGATACCCCAPALYGAVGVLFGAAASPVYWAFMDPTSPVGGLFLAASVLLLTGSALRAADSEGVRCAVNRNPAV